MASNSDLDVEDYYFVEDDNDSASSKYVPCVNYPNDKVYPEDEKNGWVMLDEDTGPPNFYRFQGSCPNYMNLNKYTPGAVFDEFYEDRMWTILNENTNKYVRLGFLHNRTDISRWTQAFAWHQARLSQVWENVKLHAFIYTKSVWENVCVYNIILMDGLIPYHFDT